MKGTILEFLKFADENPKVAKELIELAARHDFELVQPGELGDKDLDSVAGGDLKMDAIQAKHDEIDQARDDATTNFYSSVISAINAITPTNPTPTWDPNITRSP